jgi:hypothetical protein
MSTIEPTEKKVTVVCVVRIGHCVQRCPDILYVASLGQNIRKDKTSKGRKHPEGQNGRETKHPWKQNGGVVIHPNDFRP